MIYNLIMQNNEGQWIITTIDVKPEVIEDSALCSVAGTLAEVLEETFGIKEDPAFNRTISNKKEADDAQAFWEMYKEHIIEFPNERVSQEPIKLCFGNMSFTIPNNADTYDAVASMLNELKDILDT